MRSYTQGIDVKPCAPLIMRLRRKRNYDTVSFSLKESPKYPKLISKRNKRESLFILAKRARINCSFFEAKTKRHP